MQINREQRANMKEFIRKHLNEIRGHFKCYLYFKEVTNRSMFLICSKSGNRSGKTGCKYKVTGYLNKERNQIMFLKKNKHNHKVVDRLIAYIKQPEKKRFNKKKVSYCQ